MQYFHLPFQRLENSYNTITKLKLNIITYLNSEQSILATSGFTAAGNIEDVTNSGEYVHCHQEKITIYGLRGLNAEEEWAWRPFNRYKLCICAVLYIKYA